MSAPGDESAVPAGRRPRGFRQRIVSLRPFGLGLRKPHHFRDMLRILWTNRDALPWSWKILSRGVCDGCALGTSGLRDWTVDGVHLCMVRLELLRLNTQPGLPAEAFARPDFAVARLREQSSKSLRELGRLSHPLRRRRGEAHFQRVSWEQVWAEVGPRWRVTDPARTAMYVTSRGITNEVYWAAQKVMRFLGSANVDNSARLCHSPSTVGLKATLGVAATTCSYRDLFDADLIVFLGSNPANDQPLMTKYLAEARKRGARTVMVNAYREPGLERYWIPSTAESALFGTRLCDATVLVSVGGDLALLNAAARRLLERDRAARAAGQPGPVAHDFVAASTTGLAAWSAALEAQPLDALLSLCGLTLAELDAFVDELARSRRSIFVWSMGITQHSQGGDTVAAIANLALLGGHVGRPGAGLMPIRGHSGVQGGAEMGAYATALPGGLPVTAETARHFSELWGFPVPDRPGLTTTEWIEAAGRGDLDALWCIGGNFLETLPEPERVAAALGTIPLRVHADIVLTSQMLVEPAETVFVLPSRTRYEQSGGGTETTTERRVIFSPEIPGHVVGEAQSEWETLADLAEAVVPGSRQRLGLLSGAAIRADIARGVPEYAPIAGLSRQGDQFQWGGVRLCEGGRFPTADGKARFQPAVPAGLLPGAAAAARRAGPNTFLLATRRGKQFNSMVQRERDPLTGADRDHIFICPADAERLGLAAGQRIRLVSDVGQFEGRVFPAEVAPGTLQGHWPEVNVLIAAGRVEPGGGVPDYNARVRIEALPVAAARAP